MGAEVGVRTGGRGGTTEVMFDEGIVKAGVV
jgi:hypothetical protein